ncbi:MAG TPA: 2Fe-2S iron-sulfur cluster binding domain-containing protein [Candidatus Polarisedimenticolia bacterium]|jgi:ferredoxin
MPHITFQPQGVTATVRKGTTILMAAKGLGIEVRTDCEFGWCGTDPFVILSGIENLSDPDEDERENIRMNHFPPNVRMACVAKIQGDIVVEKYN